MNHTKDHRKTSFPTKIDLWVPPCIDLYQNLRKTVAKSPPLGLAYIASMLEKNGYENQVKIYDSFALDFTWSTIFELIRGSEAQYFGITCLTATLREVLLMAKVIKKYHPSAKVILGGSHPSAAPEEILSKYSQIDYLILGEGEYSFLSMIDILEQKKENSIEKIHGLAFRNNKGEVIINTPEIITDLNSIPFPAYHLLPMEKYRASAKFPRYRRYGAIISARGCPYNCTFCAAKIICGLKVRKRSVENIGFEIKLLKEKYKLQQLEILDSTFTIDKHRANRIALEINRNQMKWICNGRVNEVDKEYLRFLAQNGCEIIEFGFESADFRILKEMNKNISIIQMENAIKWSKQAGIMVSGAFMIGMIGETKDSIKKTIDFACHHPLDFFSLAIFTPYPGTEAYNIALENNMIQADFEQYRDPKHSTPVIKLHNLSDSELKRYWLKAILRFYLSVKYILQITHNLGQNLHISKMFLPFLYGLISQILPKHY